MTNADIGLGSERYSGITNEAIGLGSPKYSGIDINKAIMVSGRNQFSRVSADDCCGTWCSGWCGCDNSCKNEETSVMQLQTLKRKAGLVRAPKRSLSQVKLLARNISRFSHVTVAEIENQCGSQNLPAPPLVATQAQQADYDACVKQQKKQRFLDFIYTIPNIFGPGRPSATTGGDAGNGDDEDGKPTTPWGLIIGIPIFILLIFLGYKALTAKGKGKVK